VQNKPTGKRATVSLTIEVLVEVPEMEDDYYGSVVEKAKDDLRKRVVEAKTFLPLSIRSERIYHDVTVQELKNAIIIEPKREWSRR
jgi:hypothetical protein